MNEKTLKDQSERYARLRALTSQSGWKDFMALVEDEYSQSLESLRNPKTLKEEVEARGAMKCLERLINAFGQDLRMGKNARRKYVSKFIKETLEEGE